jgi:hypothetical protein
VGGVATRLDQRDLDAELGHLLGQYVAEASSAHFEAWWMPRVGKAAGI